MWVLDGEGDCRNWAVGVLFCGGGRSEKMGLQLVSMGFRRVCCGGVLVVDAGFWACFWRSNGDGTWWSSGENSFGRRWLFRFSGGVGCLGRFGGVGLILAVTRWWRRRSMGFWVSFGGWLWRAVMGKMMVKPRLQIPVGCWPEKDDKLFWEIL